VLTTLPPAHDAVPPQPLDAAAQTAVIMVKSFSGFGIHEVLSIHRLSPRLFKNFIFVSAAVVDSGTFKGADEIERLEAETRSNLESYVAWTRSGITASCTTRRRTPFSGGCSSTDCRPSSCRSGCWRDSLSPGEHNAPYGWIHAAKCVVPPSILIMATGLIGSRVGPMVITPVTPWKFFVAAI
jgi:hypothetical protein